MIESGRAGLWLPVEVKKSIKITLELTQTGAGTPWGKIMHKYLRQASAVFSLRAKILAEYLLKRSCFYD